MWNPLPPFFTSRVAWSKVIGLSETENFYSFLLHLRYTFHPFILNVRNCISWKNIPLLVMQRWGAEYPRKSPLLWKIDSLNKSFVLISSIVEFRIPSYIICFLYSFLPMFCLLVKAPYLFGGKCKICSCTYHSPTLDSFKLNTGFHEFLVATNLLDIFVTHHC